MNHPSLLQILVINWFVKLYNTGPMMFALSNLKPLELTWWQTTLSNEAPNSWIRGNLQNFEVLAASEVYLSTLPPFWNPNCQLYTSMNWKFTGQNLHRFRNENFILYSVNFQMVSMNIHQNLKHIDWNAHLQTLNETSVNCRMFSMNTHQNRTHIDDFVFRLFSQSSA